MSVKSCEASEKSNLFNFYFNRGRLLFGIIIRILEESRLEKTRCLWNYLLNSAVVCSSDQIPTGKLDKQNSKKVLCLLSVSFCCILPLIFLTSLVSGANGNLILQEFHSEFQSKKQLASLIINASQGSFNEYVNILLPFIDHLPTSISGYFKS